MKIVKQELHLISRPQIDAQEMHNYLANIHGTDWIDRIFADPRIADAEILVEFMGRLCYKSWKAGLNPNVTRVREDSPEYLRNILASGHGSVLEHANFSFVIENATRVLTHELVRHRAGTAFSQESMRYVRFTEIPFWLPEWAEEDSVLLSSITEYLEYTEQFQNWLGEYFGIDDGNFADKKHKTSFMRRFLPEGTATHIGFSANIRSIRHIIEMRSSEHAEEEIREFANSLAKLMATEVPLLFGDYSNTPGGLETDYRKV